jgi:hypothetical protein
MCSTAKLGMTESTTLFRCVLQLTVACFTLVGCGSGGGANDQPTPVTINNDPSTVVIETSDLKRFSEVFRAQAPIFADLENSLQRQYFDPGTPGLKSFLSVRIGSASQMAQAIRSAPAFYASILPQLEEISANPVVAQRIRSSFQKLKELAPDAVFPPTYFVVGRMTTGGTVTDQGVLIGAEFFSSGPGVVAVAPNDFIARNLRPPTDAVLIVAHEMAHYQQGRWVPFFNRTNRTLLEATLIEGCADFVAEITAGAHSNERLAEWALPREALLWAEFSMQMNGTDISRWLYNQDRATVDRPGDIGYFIGRRICEAYYSKQTDKPRAVKDILSMRDANEFLMASGYATQFPRTN